MNILYNATYVLMVIGALNWGFVGFLNVDLVAMLFGEMSTLSMVVYMLIGLSALVNISMQAHKMGSLKNNLCENC